MTRKDYELLAAACRSANVYLREQSMAAGDNSYLDGGVDGAAMLTNTIARVLSDNNPRFDVERFQRAANPNRIKVRTRQRATD